MDIKSVIRGVVFMVFFLFLFSSFTFALTTHSVSLYSGESTSFEGHNIYVLADTSGTKLMVRIDGFQEFLTFSSALELQEHKLSGSDITDLDAHFQYEDMSVTLTKVCFDPDVSSCGKINAFHELEPSYSLTFSLREPSIFVSTSYSTKSVWPGEEITVKTTIKNTGDVDVSQFVFEEYFPDGVTFKGSSTVQKDIVKNGFSYVLSSLKAGAETYFTYKIKITSPLEYSLKGQYSYMYKDESFNGETSSVSISLKDILSASLSVPSVLDIDSKEALTITFKNLVDEDVDFSFLLDVPEGVVLDHVDRDFKKEGSTYYFEGSLESFETKTWDIDVSYPLEGTFMYDLRYSSFYIIDVPDEFLTRSVKVSDNFEDVSLDVSLVYDDILEGDVVSLEAHVFRSDDVSVRSLEVYPNSSYVSLSSNYQNLSHLTFLPTHYQESSPLQDISFKNYQFDIKTSLLNSTALYQIPLVLKAVLYQKTVGEFTKTVVKNVILKVYNESDSLEISRDLNPSKVKQGEKTLAKVYLKNNLDNHFFTSVYVKDYLPLEYLFKPVMSEGYFSLSPNEEKQVYSYQLQAPYYVGENVSTLETFLDASNFSYTIYSDLSTYVEVDEPDLTLNFESDSNTNSRVVGNTLLVKGKVHNTGDLLIKDISFDFPLVQGLDLLLSDVTQGERIQSLDEGESVSFFRSYFMKGIGKQELKGSVLYKDEYGNAFESYSSSFDVSVSEGSACFVWVEKELNIVVGDSYSSREIPFVLHIKNTCLDSAFVRLFNPLVEFSIPGQSVKDYEYSKTYYGNFSGEEGTVFEYQLGDFSVVRRSVSNSIVTSFALLDTSFNSSSSSLNSTAGSLSGGSQSSGSSSKQLLAPEFSLNISGKAFWFFIIAFLVVFLMVSISSMRSYLQKKLSKKPAVLQDSLKPPKTGSNIDDLEFYIDSAKKSGFSDGHIKEALLVRGWSVDVIDVFLRSGRQR